MIDSDYSGFATQSVDGQYYKPDPDVSYFLDNIADVARMFPRIFETPTLSSSVLERAREALKNYGYLDALSSINLKN